MQDFKKQAKKLVAQMTLAEKLAQMKYDAPAIERLQIPAYNWWNECLHGVARAGAATVFPQAIAMAATFDAPGVKKTAEMISDEARAKFNEYRTFGGTEIYQGLTYWSPNINIFRDPRWGRGHETYGEDPFLTGKIGAAFVEGLQGKDQTYRKLDATLKHYAVHSGPEGERHSFDAKVSKKDLFETYLWAFRYCIRHAKPAAVMGAYNRINGEPACASPTYLKKTLYETFGFEGYVVSDCGAICDINQHHKVTETQAQSAALAVSNGCQLNCGSAYESLKVAVAEGLLTEETITAAVEKLFEARLRLGLLAKTPYDAIAYEVVECPKHKKQNLKMARESIVLLKNEGVLPLSKHAKVAVIGPNADDKSVLLGNYNGTPSSYITLLKGIQDACKGQVRYAYGCHIWNDKIHNWSEHPLREAVLAAKNSDVAILCMGLNPSMEGEEGDAYNGGQTGDKSSIQLPQSQLSLYEAIKETGTPIVFVNVSGSCVALDEMAETSAALVQVFYPGAMGGKALADVLFGKVSPSGKLPVTFYSSKNTLPDFKDYTMKNRTYRYLEEPPLYPFGFGLSYSKFTLEKVTNKKHSVSGTLKNHGPYAASQTVLVYQVPQNCPGAPGKRLAGFKKIHLKSGKETSFTIQIPHECLTLFSQDGQEYLPEEYTFEVTL